MRCLVAFLIVSMSAAHMQAMRANIRASQHMWRYNFTAQYIVDRVNGTRGDPQLDAYQPNSTDCAAAARRSGRSSAESVYSGADGAAIRYVTEDAHVIALLASARWRGGIGNMIWGLDLLDRIWLCACLLTAICVLLVAVSSHNGVVSGMRSSPVTGAMASLITAFTPSHITCVVH